MPKDADKLDAIYDVAEAVLNDGRVPMTQRLNEARMSLFADDDLFGLGVALCIAGAQRADIAMTPDGAADFWYIDPAQAEHHLQMGAPRMLIRAATFIAYIWSQDFGSASDLWDALSARERSELLVHVRGCIQALVDDPRTEGHDWRGVGYDFN